MDLGDFCYCLKVGDLEASIEFYEKLDFTILDDQRAENWVVLVHNNLVLCLFDGHIERNLLNFRGGDVEAIYSEAAERGLRFDKPATLDTDGSWSAEVRDPDGNVIYFNTFPDEREQYLEEGRLFPGREEMAMAQWYEPEDPTPREQCPCCDYISLPERGNYLICKVCFWEDDGLDFDALDEASLPNKDLTLRQARQNFRAFGACEQAMKKHVISEDERDQYEFRPRDL